MRPSIHAECRAHAVLSPSSAHRWLVCTPSARFEELFEDTQSKYAEEGSLAHELAALKVSERFGLLPENEIVEGIRAIKSSPYFDSEMARCTDDYLQHITEVAYSCPTQPVVRVEQSLDLTQYAKESFGTADCIILAGTVLLVFDFKYGRGVPVEAPGNPQMMLYALGAYERYKPVYSITSVRMTIYQPRIGNISEAELVVEDLLEWGEEVKKKAELAWIGAGDFKPSEDTCRFCRAKAGCQARAESMLQVFHSLEAEFKDKDMLLSSQRKGEILSLTKGFDKWLKDIEESALKDILSGKEVVGWKVVEGRSNRRITDEKLAAKKLKDAGFKPSTYYERRFATITALEKLVGKKELAEILDDLIEKPQGKPTLAEASDKRPVYQAEGQDPKEVFRDLQ